jgi:single-strand DNA-binding protein
MNALKNKVQLIGHLGGAPEVKQINGNKTMAKWSMATNEQFKNSEGELMEETQWHQLVCFGRLAELAEQLLDKGTEVAIEGKIQYRQYEDKEGQRRYTTEILVQELLVLDGKKNK